MSSTPMDTRQRTAAGVFTCGMGLFILAIAVGWISSDPQSFHAPRWVVGAAGLIFVCGGLLLLVNQVDTRAATPLQHLTQFLLAGVLLTLFALILNWIAFFPGEREFGGSFSLFFLTISSGSEALLGRLCFGLGAVFLDAISLWHWIRGFWGMIDYLSERRLA